MRFPKLEVPQLDDQDTTVMSRPREAFKNCFFASRP